MKLYWSFEVNLKCLFLLQNDLWTVWVRATLPCCCHPGLPTDHDAEVPSVLSQHGLPQDGWDEKRGRKNFQRRIAKADRSGFLLPLCGKFDKKKLSYLLIKFWSEFIFCFKFMLYFTLIQVIVPNYLFLGTSSQNE